MTVTVHPTLDKRRTHVLVADHHIMGDVETTRRPVYDRPFVVEGTAPARWVATISLYWRGAGLSGRQYVGADQADALAWAVAGAEAFIAETDRYRDPTRGDVHVAGEWRLNPQGSSSCIDVAVP